MNHRFDPVASEVVLSGRLTFAASVDFRAIVDRLAAGHAAEVVVNLGDTEFIDSAGLGMLLVARDAVVGRGGTICLRNARGQVARMLDLAKFEDFFTIE